MGIKSCIQFTRVALAEMRTYRDADKDSLSDIFLRRARRQNSRANLAAWATTGIGALISWAMIAKTGNPLDGLVSAPALLLGALYIAIEKHKIGCYFTMHLNTRDPEDARIAQKLEALLPAPADITSVRPYPKG